MKTRLVPSAKPLFPKQGTTLRPRLGPHQLTVKAGKGDQEPGQEQEERSNASTSTSTSKSSGDGVQDFLNGSVGLPGGYKTTRRELLKTVSLGAALTSTWVFFSRAKADNAFRYQLRRYHILEILQLLGLVFLYTRFDYLRRAMSFASPRAVLNALVPTENPPMGSAMAAETGGRVAAFKRFISDLEERGGGELVSQDFPAGADWLNVPGSLSLKKELKGKVVILDFWTFCCINCLHILPDLRFLERKYEGSPVAVVGVHSAKFDSEKDTANIRAAVIKDEVLHPVVNDTKMSMWKALGVSAWPTLVVVSPRGRIIARVSGEGHREDLDDLMAAALSYYGEKGLLDSTPVPQALERDKNQALTSAPFRFPGKVAVDPVNSRIFVADSANHRIVILSESGEYQGQVGGNGSGLRDGNLADAAFNRPQGLAYDPATETLFVCDTENHALRAVDLMNGVVTTLAGNGQKGGDYKGGKKGAAQLLNSPWDVILDPQDSNILLFAMAGTHQIWKFDRKLGVAYNFSGNGYERNANGTSPGSTSWAQPSGLAASADGKEVYVADSESSAIRALNLATGGSKLLAGADGLFSDNLFRFGDKDGAGENALLQHPLGTLTLPSQPGKVFIADSYNHKIKVLDVNTLQVSTLAGSGKQGYADGTGTAVQFAEPGGLSVGSRPDTILVSDTNNGLLRVLNVKTGAVTTLDVKGVPPPPVDPSISVVDDLLYPPVPAGATLVKAPTAVSASSGTLNLTVSLPEGFHFTPGTTPSYEVKVVGAKNQDWVKIAAPTGPLKEASPSASVKFERVAGASLPSDANLLLRVSCKVYYCTTQKGSVCLQDLVVFDVPFSKTAASGSTTLDLAATVGGI